MRGIDLGIIIAIVVATAGFTAYLVRLEARVNALDAGMAALSERVEAPSEVTTALLPAGTLVRFVPDRGCSDEGDWQVVIVPVISPDDGSDPLRRAYCEKQRPME